MKKKIIIAIAICVFFVLCFGVGVLLKKSTNIFNPIDKALAEGYGYINTGEFDKAVNTFDDILSKYSTSIRATMGKAEAQIKWEKNDDALRTIYDLTQIINLHGATDYTDKTGNEPAKQGTKGNSLKSLYEWYINYNVQNDNFEDNNSVVQVLFKDGWTIYPEVAQPVSNVASGTYTTAKTIELKSEYPIYYGVNNSDELNSDSLKYEKPIEIIKNGKNVITCIAIDENGVHSKTNTIECTLELPLLSGAVPSVASGTYTKTQYIELNNLAGVGNVYYTLDGSNPTEKSNLYKNKIKLKSGTYTLKTIVINNETNQMSQINTSQYVINDIVEEVISKIIGTWLGENGFKTTFSNDGKITHIGGRYEHKGTYSVDDTGLIKAVFDNNQWVTGIVEGEYDNMKLNDFMCKYLFDDETNTLKRIYSTDELSGDSSNTTLTKE